MFAQGESSITVQDVVSLIPEYMIAAHYLGITKIPCLVNSPFRNDKHPSIGFYMKNGNVLWTDFADKSGGDIFLFLEKLWNIPKEAVLSRIKKDFSQFSPKYTVTLRRSIPVRSSSTNKEVSCKIRDWRDYDLEYWNSYGISKQWLEFAEVYPVQKIFISEDNVTRQYPADKYAYAYVERKEGKVSMKIYQPFNTNGYKWINKHDKSVISLWTKIPEKGDYICMCSSTKDALCLWANTNIPSIAVQGEGYPISNTALTQLNSRFKNCLVIFDNDSPGLRDAEKFSKNTGFINVILPKFEGGKDISDLYKVLNNKSAFVSHILNLIKNELRKNL